MNTPLTLPELRAKLIPEFEAQGYEGIDIRINEFGVAQVSFEVPEVQERELPEVLKAYFDPGTDIQRHMDKGNTDKRSIEGARFEYAFLNYAHDRLDELLKERGHGEPDWKSDSLTIEDLDAWQALRRAVWEELHTFPDMVELQRQLDEDYS